MRVSSPLQAQNIYFGGVPSNFLENLVYQFYPFFQFFYSLRMYDNIIIFGSSNVNTTECSEEFCAFHPWQMQVCFFAGSCQACDKMNGLINEMDMHEMAQLAKIHIENSFSVVSDGSVN